MILQALTSLYEALAPKGEVPKEGWSREKISFALGIDENGDLLRITPLFKPGDMPKGKKKEEPQEMTVPAAVKRTSGAAANFLWDNSSYILGVSLKKGEDDAEREKRRNKDIKCFEACRELHHSMLDGMEYPAAKAVLNFLDKWEPQKAEENNLVAQYAKEIPVSYTHLRAHETDSYLASTEAMFTMIHSLHLSGRRRMQSKKITLGSAW